MSSASTDIPPSILPSAPGYVRLFDRWFFARPVLMPPVWTILLLAAVPSQLIFPANVLPAFSARCWTGLALTFFLAGGVYILNQVFDIESDRANNKLFFLPRRMLSVPSAVIQALVFLMIALTGGWYLGRAWFFFTAVIAFLGVLYSLPVIRLKDRPFGGLLANAVGHGTLVYFLGRVLIEPLSIPPWGGSVSYALAVAGVYLLTTVPDREGDAAAGKRTMSIYLGPQRTAVIAALLVLGALVAAAIYGQWPMVFSAAASFPFFLAATFSPKFCGSAIRVALLSLSFFACLAFLPYFLVLLVLYFSTRWYYRRRFGIVYPRLSAGG